MHCFLFTDVLLVCKALGRRGDRVRVVRPPLAVDRLLAHELRDGSGLLLVQLGDLGLLAAYCLLYTPEPRALLEHLRRAQVGFPKLPTCSLHSCCAVARCNLGGGAAVEPNVAGACSAVGRLPARRPAEDLAAGGLDARVHSCFWMELLGPAGRIAKPRLVGSYDVIGCRFGTTFNAWVG